MQIAQKPFIVDIESLVYEGYGLARHEGKVYFVRDTFPQDQVEISVLEDKKSFAFAQVSRFLKKSPLRHSSPCAFSDDCGGCQWLELDYREQLKFKTSFVIDAFNRTAKIPPSLLPHFNIEDSASEHYRNRILLRGKILETGEVRVGYFKQGTHQQTHVTQCLVAEPSLNQIIQVLSRLILPDASGQKFRLKLQELHQPLENQNKILCVIEVVGDRSKLIALKTAIQSIDTIAWVGFADEVKSAPFFLWEEWKHLKFYTKPGAFQQINMPLNHKVRGYIQDYVEKANPSSILDLFCGSGNLSLALAKKGRKLIGVENSPMAIKTAIYNCEQNSLLSNHYIVEDSAKYLQSALKKSERYDMIIADPPREGMKDCLEAILQLHPQHIIYLSCDPMTLARDIFRLKSQYELESIQAYDFFPHTYHVETLVCLKASNPPSK